MFFVRLTRIFPLLIFLGVVAGLVYLVALFKYSPPRAKEILIWLFTWLTGILSAFFGLATLYALFEQNVWVFDLMVSFFATVLVGLAVTRICNHVFLKNHPEYKKKPQKATTKRFPWQK